MENKISRQAVLTEDERQIVVTRLALFEPIKDVQKFCQDELKKKISATMLYNYLREQKWQPFIRKIRDEYNNALLEIPLANKRKRVEEFTSLYDKALAKGQLSEARRVLGDIRTEVEGTPTRDGQPSIFIAQQFNALDDKELAEKRLETIELIEKLKRRKMGVLNAPDIEGNQDFVLNEETVRK